MEIKVKKDGDVPSHMVLDKTTGWLYVVDNGNNRVLRLDIHSGNVTNPLALINETLAEHSQMGNVTWEVIINTGLDRPCGIDLIENRLLVGDYATGEIIVYDVDNNFAELDRLATGNQGLTGIKVGPDGAIWYTNRLENTVTMMLPGEVTSIEEDIYAAQVRIMPNPTSGVLSVTLPGLSDFTQTNLELKDLSGKTILERQHVSGTQQLNMAHLPNGIYMLSISTGKQHIVKKIVLQK
jgi:DNA-binding beta-propeller fold protein YncE